MSQQAIGRILLMPKGEYNSATTYNMLDWVRYNGRSWVCKQNNTVGVAPSESTAWTLLAQDGSGGSGSGDMQKAVYDTNDDGVVDSAATISGLTATVAQLNYLNTATSNIQTQLNAKIADNPTFSQAGSRTNIASGESISTLFGKIMKWFADLKDLAFIAKDGTSSTKYLRGDGTWQTFPAVPDELKDLTGDVSIVGTVTNGHVLTYDSTASKWTPQAPASGGHTMIPNNTVISGIISASADNTDDDVVSAYGIGNWSNVMTSRYIYEDLSSGDDCIGTWYDGDLEDITSSDETDWWQNDGFKNLLSDDNFEISIKFDPSAADEEVLVCTGYILDDTSGKICIRLGSEVTKSTHRIAVDITRTRTNVAIDSNG